MPLTAPLAVRPGSSRLDRRPPHHTGWYATDDGSVYEGPHVVPTRGPAAERIVAFLRS